MSVLDGIKAGAQAAAVTAAVVGSGVAADVNSSGLLPADPVQRSEIAALAAGHDALEAAADASRDAEGVAAETDISWEQTSSLVDPPGWYTEPSELEAHAAREVSELGDDGWSENSSVWAESDDSGENSAADSDAGGAR